MLLKKLKINSPHILCVINAPKDFENTLGKLPSGIKIITDTKQDFNSLHWFVKSQNELEKQFPLIIKLLKPDIRVWCYYPKISSKMQTDLTRDKGWEALLKYKNIKWLMLIAFDETWSAFAFRLKTEKDYLLEAKPKTREILKYADSTTKTIQLPEDLSKIFAKNIIAKQQFEKLAFSHRREYIEWIVTAKRDETRIKRLEGTIEKLIAGKKNPAEK